MSVKILAHTTDPEKLVASAAKLCYSASDIETLMDNLTEENINSFIDKSLAKSKKKEQTCWKFASV